MLDYYICVARKCQLYQKKNVLYFIKFLKNNLFLRLELKLECKYGYEQY